MPGKMYSKYVVSKGKQDHIAKLNIPHIAYPTIQTDIIILKYHTVYNMMLLCQIL